MRNLKILKFFLVFFSLLFISKIKAQDSQKLRTKYFIKNKFVFDSGDIVLKQTMKVKYTDLRANEKTKIDAKYLKLVGQDITITIENPADVKSTITYKEKFQMSMLNNMYFIVDRDVNTDEKRVGYVKFNDDGKIIVNPYLREKENKANDAKQKNYDRSIYSYQLLNRQKASLCFTEFTISTFTIPLKYRPRISVDNDPNPPNGDVTMARNYIPEDFSSGLNVNLFFGISIGKTSFFHRKEVGNITNTSKLTAGIFVGASTVKLNKNNTDFSVNRLENEITKGLASVGFGLTYSFNKINIGAFYGLSLIHI